MQIDWDAVEQMPVSRQCRSLKGMLQEYHRQVEQKFHKRMDAHVDKYHGLASRREPKYCHCCGNRIHDR